MSQLASIRRFLEKTYAADYVGFAILTAAYIWIQLAIVPFHRMFSLDDLRIQYPHAEHERVPVSMMFAYGGGLPFVVLLVAIAVMRPSVHKYQVTLLGLLISLVLTSFITDVVKNTVGRPRPDLIARCIPTPGLEQHVLYTIDICTSPDHGVLDEGWRSFPSGHSSFAFSGLGYLAIFLAGQLHVFRPNADLGRVLLALAPLLGALLIAISRLEDYRHDFYDVTAGSLLGLSIAHVTYRRYYPALRSAKCAVPYHWQDADSQTEGRKAHDEEEGLEQHLSSYERIPLQDRRA